MKRKTNLFYTEGVDSKFITFSNYTESMTGNFLSTDTKLFPSRFLCIKFDSLYDNGKLNEDKKVSLIKYLTCYYESKMAVLRDNEIKNNNLPEEKILPLDYLLESFIAITGFDEKNNIMYDLSRIESVENINNAIKDIIFEIPYISDITEQDYNGTYTDTICIVDINSGKHVTIIPKKEQLIDKIEYISIEEPKYNSTETHCLYGWENGTISTYANDYSIFDKDEELDKYNEHKIPRKLYRITGLLESLEFSNIKNDTEQIEFDIIIPLFDITNINYNNSFETIEDENLHNDKFGIYIDNSNNSKSYNRNVPLGIWIADETVKLKKDKTTGFSLSWSLVISSLFKPFPYSKSIPSEVTTNSKSNSFATFALVLSKLNELINTFNNLSYLMIDLGNRLSNVESLLRNVGTLSNIDSLHKELCIYEKNMNENFDKFKNDIISYIDNIRWKTII